MDHASVVAWLRRKQGATDAAIAALIAVRDAEDRALDALFEVADSVAEKREQPARRGPGSITLMTVARQAGTRRS